MKLRWLFGALFIFFICNSGFASVLMLSQVLASASLHFPLILMQQQNIEAVKSKLKSAKGAFDPIFKSALINSPTGYYHYTYFNTELSARIPHSPEKIFTGYRVGVGNFQVYKQQQLTYDLGEARAGIAIPLLRNFSLDKERANIKAQEINLKISNQLLAEEKLKVARDAATAYWTWVDAGLKLKIQEKLLALAVTRQSALNERVVKGDIPKIDATDNERLIKKRQIACFQQEQIFQKTSLWLSLYYRDHAGNPQILSASNLPKKIPFSLFKIQLNAHDLDMSIKRSPIIRQIQQQEALSNLALSLANNDKRPKLEAKVYAARDFGEESTSLDRTSINLELNFQSPIFRTTAIGQQEMAIHKLNSLYFKEKMSEQKIKVNILNETNKINYIINKIKLSRQELSLAKKVENAEEIKFQQGDSQLIFLNLREQSTAEIRMSLIDTLADYHIAIADYRYTTSLYYPFVSSVV